MAICKSIPVSNVQLQPEQYVSNAELKASIFYDKFSGILQDYEDNAVYDANRFVDTELLAANTIALNRFVRSEIERLTPEYFSTTFPNLYERISINPYITPAETQRVIEDNLLIPDIFNTYLQPYVSNISYLLDNYFASDSVTQSSAGSFCSMATDIFAKFNAAKDMLTDVMAFAQSLETTISSILDGGVAAIIEMVKQKIFQLIDRMVEQVLQKIQNFTTQFTQMAQSFLHNVQSVYARVDRLRNQIQGFLSDNNITNMKSLVESMIGFAASLFEEIKLEEVMFLLLRFCEFMGQIENLFNGLTQPLEEIQNNFTSSHQVLTSAGNAATARALAAGALRFQPQQLNAGIQRSQDVAGRYTGGNSGGGALPIRGRAANIRPPTQEEIDALPTWEDIRQGNSEMWTYSSGMGEAGYTGAQTLEKVMLLRLRRRWGRRFNINSAFRSQAYNDNLRRTGSGVARNSMHLSGQAFDINVTSDEFVRMAIAEGFGGIGYYSSFTHIDSRPNARWGSR